MQKFFADIFFFLGAASKKGFKTSETGLFLCQAFVSRYKQINLLALCNLCHSASQRDTILTFTGLCAAWLSSRGHNNFLIWAQVCALIYLPILPFSSSLLPPPHCQSLFPAGKLVFDLPLSYLTLFSRYPFFVKPRSFDSNICCISLQLTDVNPAHPGHVMQMPTSTPETFAIWPCARLWLALVALEPALTAALNWLSVAGYYLFLICRVTAIKLSRLLGLCVQANCSEST